MCTPVLKRRKKLSMTFPLLMLANVKADSTGKPQQIN